ncbi:hypothetical protein LO762_30250 [Actinocorallia sp. API 0066]|uniref:hypothetical protein n=1 Tax=Actinocorallia sp. API 0066 TaxID=2896846 RepID=UPI001E53E86F|nr:hypothetical protein [Actinocorallia sp. API 0066]MCD0453432.1 hypothetical protein [Actinocorallia sp. API 0066]
MWDVLREDGSGNQVRVARHQTRVSALAQVLTFESGVPQTRMYWVDGPPGPQLATNRDLYLHLLRIGKDARAAAWSLSALLRSLWKVGSALRDTARLEPDQVAALFSAAAGSPPPAFDPAWSGKDLSLSGDPATQADWEKVLLSQIADLEDFVVHPAAPVHGVSPAPRPYGSGPRAVPARWRNFDPAAYLECAVAGAFGGWDVADGSRVPRDGGPSASPVRQLGLVSWFELSRLLACGQLFE